MYDTIEKLGQSTIQHGKSNNRIYLMKLSRNDLSTILESLKSLAAKNHYTKIFAKIPEWAKEKFQADGYTEEANIPNFYNGKTDVFFLSKFIDSARAKLESAAKEKIEKNIQLAQSKQGQPLTLQTHPDFTFKILADEDVLALTKLYELVFKSYPFPIFEPDYIRKTMRENIEYFGMYAGERLVAASSAEMDIASENVEMTDFATDPEFAGNNLSLYLLREMEAEMRKKKMKTMLYHCPLLFRRNEYYFCQSRLSIFRHIGK